MRGFRWRSAVSLRESSTLENNDRALGNSLEGAVRSAGLSLIRIAMLSCWYKSASGGAYKEKGLGALG
jgi:hypothetical protein